MSNRFSRINHWLLLAVTVLCISFAGLFTYSSPTPDLDSICSQTEPELYVSDTSDDPSPSSVSSMILTSETDSADKTAEKKSSASKKFKVSPEASKGVWTSSGSSWMFLIDGVPFSGWLTDTDKKRYYFGSDGIMQTGWITVDGKTYYMDMDGIMQTEDLKIGKKTYHFNEDGSLKGKSPMNKKSVALTFDDGPSSFTGRLLDCLEKNNAKATFFMTGSEIASFPEEVKRMSKLGCELGNHTYDHKDLTTLSQEEVNSEIDSVNQQLTDLTGHSASVIRPPYGAVNDMILVSVNVPVILWSIDTLDWKTKDVQATVQAVMDNVQDGSIILMHDIFSTSVDAAEILIPQLINNGYNLVTVSELARLHNTNMVPGTTYGGFTR